MIVRNTLLSCRPALLDLKREAHDCCGRGPDRLETSLVPACDEFLVFPAVLGQWEQII